MAEYKAARSKSKDDEHNAVAWVDQRPYLYREKASTEPEMRAVVIQLLSVLHTRQNANHIDKQQLTITDLSVVTGGITNKLYKVTFANEQQHPALLVRIFGAEGMIDRDAETEQYAQLARLQIAPPYIGRFANGRLEGWMDGYRPLETNELSQPIILTKIAQSLARLHQVPIDTNQEPTLFRQLLEWLSMAETATFQTDRERNIYNTLHIRRDIRPQVLALQNRIQHYQLPVVCCHNDILAANVLWNDRNIQLIDFEYGGPNYSLFDIANHFNEWAGGPPEHAQPNYNLFPTRCQQRAFLESYLGTPKGVEQQLDLLHHFVAANHLYWGLWAVNQAQTEGCDEFDYITYAKYRMEQYWVVVKEEEEEDDENEQEINSKAKCLNY